MKRIDVEHNEGKMEEFLKQNSLQRNKNLNTILYFLNSIEDQLILNLDDNWGTGKTVFLKQIEYMNKSKIESIPSINMGNVSSFQNKYEVFYFNAWEHDLYNNPLESLINSLLMKMSEISEEQVIKTDTLKIISTKLKQLGILSINTALKSVTGGAIEIEDLKMEKEDLSKTITSIDSKREAINQIIQVLLESSDKKLLIIIDELDRCKPTFAVELLEIVKHFFINDDVVFIFGTNKKELSETIKGKYGSNFDGYKYLNRFFDFEFSLPECKIEDYLNFINYGNYTGPHYYKLEMVSIAKYFNFTMRDINRYVSICDTCINYWRGSSYYVKSYQKYLFIPFAIALRIHSGLEYQKFINGNGREILENYYDYNDTLHNKIIVKTLDDKSIQWESDDNFKQLCKDELLGFYEELSKSTYSHTDEEDAMLEILDVISMMSDYTKL